jgi:Cu/Ag efflux protein CusF
MNTRSIALLAFLLASLNLQAQEPAASPEKLSFSATQEVQLTAVIDAIDLEARTVTLTGPLGNSRTLQAREDSTNIEKIKVGDEVDVRYVQNLTVQLFANDGMEPGAGVVAMQGGNEEGEAPAAMELVSTVETAVVEEINLEANTFRLRWPSGEVTEYEARDPENLKKGEVGDLVAVTYTEAVALSLV